MKKQAVIFIILLLPFYSNGQAITPKQLLRRTTESLKEINSVIYKINRLDKHFSSKDTLITTALCSLYIAPKDKLGMYYVINSKAKSNSFNHERYNGKEYFFFNISKDASNSVKAKNFEFADLTKQDYVSGNYNIKFLAYEIFNRKKNISRYNSLIRKRSIKEFNVKETFFSEIPSYELTIIYKNNVEKAGEILNMVEKYYIRKNDYLPIGYVFTGDFEGMKGYEEYTIEYIKINPNLTIRDFQYLNGNRPNVQELFNNISIYIL